MSAQRDYWQECMAIAAEECELTLTPEQLDCLASSAESGHDHYGMVFYSPPPGERLSEGLGACPQRRTDMDLKKVIVSKMSPTYPIKRTRNGVRFNAELGLMEKQDGR